jgi:hypothetical protein
MTRLKNLFESSSIAIARFDHAHDKEQCIDGDEICPA